MAEKLTPQQQQAVQNRGGKLLVSAAAGSGKTKVLVDRLMSYLTDEQAPAELDEFLIITYTKAAASELRGKIAAKLSERIAEEPENRHLHQQLQRLYLTRISTVHAFCADILREYAYLLDISGDFRVADENECRQLRDRVMAQTLDEAYAAIGQEPDIRAFVDTQGLGRDDRLVPEIILKVYDSAQCHLSPQKWLAACEENGRVEQVTDAGETIWGRYLMEELFFYLDGQIAALTRCAEASAQTPEFEKPTALLRDTVYQLQHLRDSESWDQVADRRAIDYGRISFPRKGGDPALAERIKAVRNACKKSLDKRLEDFSDKSERILRDLSGAATSVRGLVRIVGRFSELYGMAKRSRRVLDFGDLEHKALDLLLGKSRQTPTAAAREIGSRFREIMVDEYQDSNQVQDAIFSALTAQKQNCFLVGDVKQSIYQFRLADPGIFLEKYHSFVPAGQAQAGQGRKVLLSSNFRSGGAVLEAANHVFATCMTEKVGGLVYGQEEALREGIPHTPLGEPEVEFYALDVRDETYPEEATFTAQRIRELLDGAHMIREGEGLRPIRPEDVVILLRSPGSSGNHYRQALEARGIHCTTGGGTDLLQTGQIGTLRAILQTISNPRQDIPLLAALASPVFGFTADDLAAFRSGHRRGCIYDALLTDPSEKAERFRQTLARLRRCARMNTLAQLLEEIYLLTHMESLYGSMAGGEVKRANLQIFYQLAVDFEANGRRDLGQFLEHLDAIEERGLTTTGEGTTAGSVTIMSIHKSKGLEFPVVFLCGLSREFNRESANGQVLCHKELGLGLCCVDSRNRIRYPDLAKRAISARIIADGLSEEMRVLYVAMTRARDRLIMTYATKNVEKKLTALALKMDDYGPELLSGEALCPGQWVLQAALRRSEAGTFFACGARPSRTVMGEYPWKIVLTQAPAVDETPVEQQRQRRQLPVETFDRLRKGLAFRYDHLAATTAPSKQTATQRKGRQKDQEVTEGASDPVRPQRSWRKPEFGQAARQGKDFGSMIHKVLQYLRYEACDGLPGVKEEMARLVREGFLTQEQADAVDCGKLARLFASPLGARLRTGPNVLREFKFSILEDGVQFGPELAGEQILLQGVVDCALVEPDGITVVDYKTDHVTQETLPDVVERYRPQVGAYGSALSRIFQLPIKAQFLYFFRLEQFVPVG